MNDQECINARDESASENNEDTEKIYGVKEYQIDTNYQDESVYRNEKISEASNVENKDHKNTSTISIR